MTIGKRFKEIRRLNLLSQQDFAGLISISVGTVSKIESDKQIPSAETLTLLACKLNVNLHWLLTGQGSMFLCNEQTVLADKHNCTLEEYELIMKFLYEEKDLALYAAKAVINKDSKALERFIKLTES